MVEYSPVRLAQTGMHLDRQRITDVLRRVDVAYDAESEPHVVLRPSTPWVQDRGWLNFIGNWHYFSQPPGDNAGWVRAIAPSSAGMMEIWLTGLTPKSNYLVAIHVGCSVGGPDPGFKIGASDAAGQTVNAQPPEQVLLVIISPDMETSLVTVQPQQLESWSFYKAEVAELP